MASMVRWNAVHLLALTVCSLLLVATFSEARPRIRTDASSSACSLACPPSPHWRGYRPGRVYRYRFEQGIELATDLPNGGGTQRRNLNSSGVFEVRAITECELAVSVSEAGANAGADYAAPRTAPSRLARALRLPLRVWHREGRFEQLCPTEGEGEGEGETRESLNLKRALLSQLQVASGQRGRWHQLEERDILGDCWTEYIPEGPNSLLKTKDLARCRMLAFEAYPLKGEKGIPDERIQASRPVTLGSLACRLELHAEFDIPRDVACEELRSTSETSAAGDTRLATRTRLRLLQPEPETGEPETEPTPWTAGRRTDLRQEHRSSVECQTSSRFDIGSECLERAAAAGGEGSDAQDAAWRLVSELCREASAKSLGRETPGKFAELVGQLRRMQSRVQLNRIYQRLLRGFCSENPSLKGVVRSAIAAAGTRPALQLILQQILSERNSWSVDALSQLPHPTVGMLQDVLDFVNRRRSRGNWQGEALALGDLVYRVCREHRGCGTDPAVARVVRFFSDQLGSEEACSRLQVGSCYTADAFVALLAVGNMGRAGGGASALVGCAANPRLALAHRVFALQSLRRFDYDKDNEAGAGARDRLARLLLDGALDAELRIAAYRALAAIGLTGQRADSLRSAVRRLLTSPNEDRQTQLFVRTHLSGLAGGASDPLLDKAAVAEAAKLLQEAAESAPDIAKELDRLSWREYSSAWRLQHFSHDWATGGRIEASVVFSPQSAIPRYIGLNLTLIDPGRGRQVNALELGLRIEGVDDEAHEAYKLFAQRVRRQTVGVDLTPEQESRMQAAQEPRVDIVVRQSGAEVSHSTVSGIGLTAPLQLLKNIDFSTIRQLMEALPQFKKFFDSKRSSMSAGVLSEEAVSLPTISGAPLIVKSSAHYLTELRLDKVLDLSWTGNSSARLELRPVAALRQSRTVSVDAPFERMGVRTNLSFLTNTGLGLSLERARSDEADSDQTISMKLEPLDKRQSLADAKTDAAFFWHAIGADGEATPVEQPLVPSEVMEQSVRCTDNFIKKHSGLKLCVQSKKVSSASSSSASGDTASLLSSLRRSPGSFQLYLEKNDSLGGFELYFRQKRPTPLDPGNNRLELLIGDRNSPDRMLKLALRSSRSTGSSSWRFELINPVFPVSLFAQVTNSTSESQLQADVRIGSVEYKAEGAAQWASADSPQMRLAGSFYRKDKVRQRVEISLAHRMDGRVLVLLPRASTAFNLTLQSGNQLRLLYDLQTAAANFTWKIASEYASPAGVLHSVQYQLKYENKFNNSRRDYGAVIYDLEVRNAEGRRVGHSLHAKLQRSIGAISRANVSVLHQLRLGSALRRSPLDFKLQVGLSETINGATFSAEGNGQLTYYRRDTGQEVTAKLEGLRVSMEENSNIDPVGSQSLYEINCGLGYEGYKASYKGVLRYLPRRDWERLRQAFELQLGAQLLDGSIGSEVTHYWHLKNYVFMPDGGRQIASAQIARVVYANETLLHIDHRLNRESPLAALRHDLLVQSKLISQLKLNSSVSLAQEGIMSIDTSLEFSSSQVFQCKQKFEYIGLEEDHQVKHRAQLLLKNLYVLESDARVSRETAASLLRFLLYQRRIVAGRYNFRYSLALFARFLASMRFNETSRLTGPEPDRRTVLENVIDLAQTNGTVWKNQLMAHFDGSEVFNYGLLLERQSRDEVQRLRAFQVEAFGSGQSFRTRLEARMKSSASQAETRLNLTSGDTWGWHRVEADAAVLIKGEQSLSWRENAETEAASQLHFDTKLTGHVLNRRIDSNGMIGIWKQISSTGRVFRVTSAAGTPKANATFNLKLLRSPEVLQLTNSLTNSLTFLPFRQLGSTIDVKSTPGTSYASLLSEFQVDNDKVASAKALHSPAVSLIDVKTKHSNFQEIKLKIGREQLTGLAGETNFTAIAKFHAFGWKVGARQSGIVTANTNPAKYKRLVSVRGDLELVGLENYIQRKRFNGEALLQLKHSNEFDLLFSVATPSPAGIELPLLRLSSNFEFAPLRAELKLRTAGSSGRLLSYGARVEFEPSRKANADVEFGERRAELGWSLQPSLGGAGRSAQFLARNSFLVAQPVFVHGVLNSTWPLRAEPLEASMEVRLSSTRFPGMSMRLVNYLERKLALLSIIAQPDNSVTDVFRLSYNQSADFEGIRGDTFAKFDLSSFSENIATRSVRVNYLFGVEKELHFEASQDSTAIHTGRILWYSEPRQVASVRGVAEAADFVVAIKSQRSWAVYLARSPIAASRSSVWHLSYDQFNDANQLSTPFSAKVEISDPWSVRNGEVSIYEKTFELRTHPAGGIELVVKTGAPVLYRVLWSSSGDSGTAGDKSMRLEIRVDDSITVAEIVRRPGQAVVTYGRQDAPNTLTVAYTVSGNRMNLTSPGRQSKLQRSDPARSHRAAAGHSVQAGRAKPRRSEGDFQLSLASSAAGSLTYGHSLSRLPRALSARANLTGPRGDSLWQLSADLDRGERIAEIRTSLNGVFHFVLAEQLLQFRSSDVADLSLAFPSFRTSRTNQGGVGAKAVSLNLTVPLLGLRRSVELAAEHQLVENGRKVVLSYGRAGAEMLNGYLTVTEQTDHGVNFSVEAQLTSNAGLLWSATTVKTQMSAGMLRGEDNYTMAFSSRVFVDGIENSAVTAGLLGGSGGWPSRPSRGSARAAGFTDWEVGFDLSRPDGSKSLGGRLVRWAGAQVGPYSANASLGSTGQPGGRDFRFETESPQRHFVVAKEFDPTLDRKSLKFFINRRLNRGLVVALQRGPEPQQRALEFELPTRLIRVEIRPLQSRSESSSGLGVRVAWDAARAPDREIRLDLMAGSEGSVWAASATCEAPFLLDRMTLELRRELRRTLAGDRETARAQVGFERQLRRIDLLLETSGPTAGDGASSRLSATVEMDGDSLDDESRRRRLRLFLGDVRIEVPSHGVNKSFKFVYRPMREFTCAGDNGSAISLRFAPGQRLDRFTVFASGNDRQAARLDAVLDKRRSRLTAALDTGLGGFDFPADLRASRRFGGGSGGPGFRPNATLVFASAGVSDDGRRAHAAVLVGRMQFGQWPDPAEPASVPAGLNLFSLGLRLHGNNSVEGSSAWRSERVDGVKSAVAHLKESLLDTWMASSLRAFGSASDALLRAAGERLLKSVDAKRLAEEATNPLLADLTALKLYAEAVVEAAGSDPRLGAIVRLLKRFSGAASWRVAE
uniref:Vitellogenin domain-containing protein n=1 Tax=Macrostomum lignano TaxID=282301 RepID=A0A1I8JD41_9PLAT